MPGYDYVKTYKNGYYLLETDLKEVTLSIGVTKNIKTIKVIETDKQGNNSEYSFELDSPFTIKVDKNSEYKMSVNYDDETNESLKFKFK